MTNRRIFLLSSLGAMAGFAAWRLLRGSDETAIIAVLRKRLHYLKLDEAGVQAFATDLAAKHMIARSRLRLLNAMGSLYSGLELSGNNMILNSIHHGEERIVTNFLLSSDFFKMGADETRVVHYLGYYDPLIACGNPFARITVS